MVVVNHHRDDGDNDKEEAFISFLLNSLSFSLLLSVNVLFY